MSMKTQWTESEDALLRQLVEEKGPKQWGDIAAQIKTKTSKQCRRRWNNCLNADLKTGGWTSEEDRILMEGHKLHGNKWTEIAKMVGGRTDNAVKNRFAALSKRTSPRNPMGAMKSFLKGRKRRRLGSQSSSEGKDTVLGGPPDPRDAAEHTTVEATSPGTTSRGPSAVNNTLDANAAFLRDTSFLKRRHSATATFLSGGSGSFTFDGHGMASSGTAFGGPLGRSRSLAEAQMYAHIQAQPQVRAQVHANTPAQAQLVAQQARTVVQTQVAVQLVAHEQVQRQLHASGQAQAPTPSSWGEAHVDPTGGRYWYSTSFRLPAQPQPPPLPSRTISQPHMLRHVTFPETIQLQETPRQQPQPQQQPQQLSWQQMPGPSTYGRPTQPHPFSPHGVKSAPQPAVHQHLSSEAETRTQVSGANQLQTPPHPHMHPQHQQRQQHPPAHQASWLDPPEERRHSGDERSHFGILKVNDRPNLATLASAVKERREGFPVGEGGGGYGSGARNEEAPAGASCMWEQPAIMASRMQAPAPAALAGSGGPGLLRAAAAAPPVLSASGPEARLLCNERRGPSSAPRSSASVHALANPGGREDAAAFIPQPWTAHQQDGLRMQHQERAWQQQQQQQLQQQQLQHHQQQQLQQHQSWQHTLQLQPLLPLQLQPQPPGLPPPPLSNQATSISTQSQPNPSECNTGRRMEVAAHDQSAGLVVPATNGDTAAVATATAAAAPAAGIANGDKSNPACWSPLLPLISVRIPEADSKTEAAAAGDPHVLPAAFATATATATATTEPSVPDPPSPQPPSGAQPAVVLPMPWRSPAAEATEAAEGNGPCGTNESAGTGATRPPDSGDCSAGMTPRRPWLPPKILSLNIRIPEDPTSTGLRKSALGRDGRLRSPLGAITQQAESSKGASGRAGLSRTTRCASPRMGGATGVSVSSGSSSGGSSSGGSSNAGSPRPASVPPKRLPVSIRIPVDPLSDQPRGRSRSPRLRLSPRQSPSAAAQQHMLTSPQGLDLNSLGGVFTPCEMAFVRELREHVQSLRPRRPPPPWGSSKLTFGTIAGEAADSDDDNDGDENRRNDSEDAFINSCTADVPELRRLPDHPRTGSETTKLTNTTTTPAATVLQSTKMAATAAAAATASRRRRHGGGCSGQLPAEPQSPPAPLSPGENTPAEFIEVLKLFSYDVTRGDVGNDDGHSEQQTMRGSARSSAMTPWRCAVVDESTPAAAAAAAAGTPARPASVGGATSGGNRGDGSGGCDSSYFRDADCDLPSAGGGLMYMLATGLTPKGLTSRTPRSPRPWEPSGLGLTFSCSPR
ncbi:hypothetical protein Vretimale_5888 [Volvox reticuliferus]|uniref:Uncharacterized protein n=1 Tax=Volvox reticuliferus TaxID=1737510 RepID=A0A8J4G6F2_9CHLO|nr:hypothetical protein Vretifemale_5919 [Volvox reticuliferus]GIM01016.1 hypothetical protein Vretimale_5888 [Volvox reticuliferus]